MGIGGISFWQVLIILVLLLVLFGGKKIKNMGSDLGEGLKGFKKAIKDDDVSKSDSDSDSKKDDK
jgi:sec-independent protein translocase protein TatA